mgnify:CR=1 FL=1
MTNNHSIIINNNSYPLTGDETIYDCVSKHFGRDEIPTLCHDPILEPFGACRICMVEVKHKNAKDSRLMAACHTPASADIEVITQSERLTKARKGIVELLLSNYPKDKLTPAPGEAPSNFQKLLEKYQLNNSRYPDTKEPGEISKPHPYINFNPDECIHCYRCVRACDEVQGQFALAMSGRGIRSSIIQGLEQDFSSSGCVSCGLCVQTCPTNALSDRYQAKTILSEKLTRTICTYCGVGCNLEVKTKNNQVIAINGVKDSEVNQGHTCVKGRYAFEYVNHPERLTSPMIRKNGELVNVSWDEAFTYIANRLEGIKEQHGADAIAGISSARCTNEENYLMQKFMRVVVGTNNIDGCARVCHSPTAFGMDKVYGTGAATNSIDEIPLADCLLLFGANPTEAHPVTGAKIKQATIAGAKLIVVDPRRSELAKYASCHLQLRPGSNIALLQMLCYYLIELDYVDQDFVKNRTEGFADFKKQILSQDIAQLAEITGLKKAQVKEAAHIYGQAQRAMSFHGLGITEHYQGSHAIMLLSGLVMMTGNVGRVGTGVNPLRGQNNVQGAVDVGVRPDLGAGYLDYKKPEIKQHFESVYKSEIPIKDGLKIPQMFQAAREGKLKALWIMGEDILQTDPNSCQIEYSLSMLDLLIVQELFMTQTCEGADVVLPASSFFEKNGTFTNSERRIQRVNQTIKPLPGTKPDGEIIANIMQKMGYKQSNDTTQVLTEISKLVPFFEGVSWDNIKENGKQWPVQANGEDTQILHQDKFSTDGMGKGQFYFFDFEQSPEILKNAKQYPYILTTGRRLEHYNCGSMTRRTPNAKLLDKDVLLINKKDAEKNNVNDGDVIGVSSANGKTHLVVQISDEMKPGILFTTFHFPEIAINQITSDVHDQETMTPEYKVVSVQLEPVR